METFLDRASWVNAPIKSQFDGRRLVVEAGKGSDLWEETLHRFQRDPGHALLASFEGDGSLEVSFSVRCGNFRAQAGLLIWSNKTKWIGAGLQISEGVPHAAVVVSHGRTEWSLRPEPEWAEREVTIRASWSRGAVTVRARCGKEEWRTLQVTHLAVAHTVKAGLYLCSQDRPGFSVAFTEAKLEPVLGSEVHSQQVG